MSSEINYNVCVTNVEGKNMSSIGANIKNLREQHGMSQNELAAKIGKSRAAISQYEHGNTIPRMGVIEDMARVFGVKKSAPRRSGERTSSFTVSRIRKQA